MTQSAIAPVLIAGAGIGGLTLALELHRLGVPCRVFEAAPELRPLGLGINVQTSATLVFRRLGIEDEIAATAPETTESVYHNRHGQEIWREPRGRAAGYPIPQYSIHRGELQMILYRAALSRLGAQNILLGHRLAGFEDRGDEVIARFDTAEGEKTYAGSALIGADGIHSVVRKTLYPDEGEPIYSGRMMYRGRTLWTPYMSGRSMVWFGYGGQKFMGYPMSVAAEKDGKAMINFVLTLKVDQPAPQRADWNRRISNEEALKPFRGWHFDRLDVHGVIENAEEIFEFPLVDRDPLPRWTHGRVTLLGDAAHPMYPAGSNGAAQAVIDAETLADLLAKADVPAALDRYDDLRREASAQVVLANRTDGPDQVLNLAEERAPDGFDDIEDVIPHEERVAIAAAYKKTAGFSVEQIAQRATAE